MPPFSLLFLKTGSASDFNLKETLGLDEDPGETEVQGCFDLSEINW